MGEPPELLELPEPASPGPGELLIEVQAAGIGPWDAFVGAGGWDVGLRPPAALGVEGTGVVAAVGETSAASRLAMLFSCTRRHCRAAVASGPSRYWSTRATLPVDRPG